jgi:hypothetical protein
MTRTRRPGTIALAPFFCLTLAASALAQSEDELHAKKAPPKPRCPAIEDPAGNAGGNPVDFVRLLIDNDATRVYFRVEFAEAPTGSWIAGLYLNTDFDQVTGCNVGIPRLNGAEYYFGFSSPNLGDPWVGDVRDCMSGSDDFPDRGGALGSAKGSTVVLSVPIETLQLLGQSNGFLVWFDGGGNFGPAAYTYKF